jgi:hypothetical protein
MLGNEDAYYFRRGDSFVLPAYRVILIGAKADVPGLRILPHADSSSFQ